jgi:hypothetical protein
MAGVPFAHRKRKIGEMSGVVAGIERHPIELRNRTVAILLDAGIEVGLGLVDAVTQGVVQRVRRRLEGIPRRRRRIRPAH